VLANGYITEPEYPKYGKKLKVEGLAVEFFGDTGEGRDRAGGGEHSEGALKEIRYSDGISRLPRRE
jgi:hypothetical protein